MRRVVVVGSGFAGVWSALSAVRLLDKYGVGPNEVEVVVVAPHASLDLRPRFYEPNAATMTTPLGHLFEVVGIRFVAGKVEAIDPKTKAINIASGDGSKAALTYDRLILASGSRLARPDIPGLAMHGFSIDQLDEATIFEDHLHGLAMHPDCPARNTAIVVGAGFTGIEIATELPARLRSILGGGAPVRVILIERSDVIGPELGIGPRSVISEALTAQGVECRLGSSITKIDAGGVCTTAGERIESFSVLWTGGMRASQLTSLIPGERDQLGRLCVDRDLRVPTVPEIFAAGDTACAATDDLGNRTLMSCQHALMLGRFAGNNAAADLIGGDLLPYSQERYVTCLDLGSWGAVFTAGWDRKVEISGAAAKERKRFINSIAIAPPPPVREAALAAADPMRSLAGRAS